jgi:hypothetical protein
VKECFPGGFVYGGMVRGEHKVRPECIKKNKKG